MHCLISLARCLAWMSLVLCFAGQCRLPRGVGNVYTISCWLRLCAVLLRHPRLQRLSQELEVIQPVHLTGGTSVGFGPQVIVTMGRSVRFPTRDPPEKERARAVGRVLLALIPGVFVATVLVTSWHNAPQRHLSNRSTPNAPTPCWPPLGKPPLSHPKETMLLKTPTKSPVTRTHACADRQN